MAPPADDRSASPELKFVRLVCVLAAVLYPAWGVFCLYVIPHAVENVAERGVVAVLALVLLAGSFLDQAIARRLPALIYLVYLSLTTHYLYVIWHNHFAPMYVIGTFIVVTAIDACITAMRPFVAYSLFVIAGSVTAAALAPESGTFGPFLAFGLFTTQLLHGVSLGARLQATRRLAASQAALEHANVELRLADRYKNDFLAIMSHELRTPLNAILGFGSVLDDEVAGPLTPTQHGYLQKMNSAAQVLLDLVTDLLDMSRIQAGRFAIEPCRTSFKQINQGVLERLAPLASAGSQRLVDEVPEDLPPLNADPARVAQVITNLVSNALKFNRPGAIVVVAARIDGQALRCEVRDSGDGIPEKDRARLFQPFTQLDSSRTRKAGGTGLGLSISKALIEAHGGTLGVESVPGEGTTFYFTLPL